MGNVKRESKRGTGLPLFLPLSDHNNLVAASRCFHVKVRTAFRRVRLRWSVICMARCCLGIDSTVKEFTFLLIQVLHVSHPAALEGSTSYAREIVDRFFRKYTE